MLEPPAFRDRDRTLTFDELADLATAGHDWLRKRGVPHFLGAPEVELEHRGWHLVFVVVLATIVAVLLAVAFDTGELGWPSEIGVTVGILMVVVLWDVRARIRRREKWPWILPRPGYKHLTPRR